MLSEQRFGEAIGIVGNEARPDVVEVVSRYPLPLGTYVVIPFVSRSPTNEEEVVSHLLVGVVSRTMYRRTVPVSGAAALASSGLYAEFEKELAHYGSSLVRIVADIVGGNSIRVPRAPPPPNAPVYLAPSHTLAQLFSRGSDENTIKIGHLVGREDVEIKVCIDSLAKHLFITGTTGSGKSNTVAILIDRIASMGGVVVVYDVHGEYANLEPESRNVVVKPVDLFINPLVVSPRMLARMIVPEASATVQRRLVEKALREVQKVFSKAIESFGVTEQALEEIKKEIRISTLSGGGARSEEEHDSATDVESEMVKLFRDALVSIISSDKHAKTFSKSVEAAVAKVEEFFEYTPISFRQKSPVDYLDSRTIVVLNASALDDEQRDYMLKMVADELLWFSKRRASMGKPMPLILVIEEAHNFLPANRETISRRSVERLAREGRKFGVCLFVVSQRPRNIDPNTVSQIQNFVFMKLVQEADQRAVMNASDMLTEDLAMSLSTMDTGEALIMGEWIGRFPAFVKIDMHRGKKVGATPRLSEIWRSIAAERDRGSELSEIHEAAVKDLEGLI